MQKVGGNNELIVENSTRSRTGGYLKNLINGRTGFGYAVDSASISGSNLTLWRGAGAQNIVIALPAGGSGVTALSPIGSTPNANGATITGTTLNLQPASVSFGGVVTTGVQSFAQTKIFDSIRITPTVFVADSIWFSGTSITGGVGASSLGHSFPYLTANKLNALPAVNGCSGCSMWIEGVNATNLGLIPTYSSTKYRWMVLEWGTNDMQLNVTDTATYAAAYLRYLDTAIARGWPVSKILVLSPSFVDISIIPAATAARQSQFQIATQAIASRRSTQYLDIYSIEVDRGGALLFIPGGSGIHPTNYGVSVAYVNPITAKLTDSVRSQGQSLAINGLTELQKLKLRTTDTASAKSVPIGIDSSGNIVRYDNNTFIANGNTLLQAQSASINLAGKAYFNNVTSPTPEPVQIVGTLKASFGRFTSSILETGLTGQATEIGVVTGSGYIQSYDRTAVAALPLVINFNGGQTRIGTATGGTATLVTSSITAGTGQFNGALASLGGSGGIEIATFSGMGYLGAFNRTGGVPWDITMQGLGGSIMIGSLNAPSAKLHIISTAEQRRTGYDASNYFSTTVGSTGSTTLNLVGTSPEFTFSDPVNVPDDPYDAAGWNGNTEVPTKNAIRDKIEAIVSGTPLSSITAATTSASIDNGSNPITWAWNGNPGGSAMTFSSNSTTLPTANSNALFEITSSGANGASVTRTGLTISVQNTGDAATNAALTLTASGGSNNYALIANTGNSGFYVAAPTAKVHIGAGTATASTASLKINEGSRQTTPEDGTINYVANNLEFVETSTVYTIAKTLTNTATLNFDLTAVNSQDLTITVTGAVAGDPISLGLDPASVSADITFFGWVSASNTVTVRCSRVGGGGAVDPASGTFRATVIRY